MSFHFSAIQTSSLKLRQAQEQKFVELNRNVVGTCLHIWPEMKKMIDFGKALEYPLHFIPLSLANLGGSSVSTTKSTVLKVITQKCELPLQHPREIQPLKDSVTAELL